MSSVVDRIIELSPHIRYAAILRGRSLEMRQRDGVRGASSNESDRYEELLVNPALLTLAGRRGDIDCGGLDHVIVEYRNFRQLVLPARDGHVSVCFERAGDPGALAARIRELAMQDTVTTGGGEKT